MKKFLKYMSPFAPDQSGACSVFYEFGGLIVICDAGGCAGNICGFDEPRWFDKKSAVFSAGLRDMDAIMGRDDKLIEKLSLAYDQLGGNFALIVSTPVPAVIATDMRSLERMGEKKLGIPCIALDCTGTHYYDNGEEKAWLRLFETFAKDKKDTVKGRIGILGATPMETGFKSGDSLKELLPRLNDSSSDAGEYVIYSMGSTLEDVKDASTCEKNIVISSQSLKAAEYLKETFGIPYEIKYPFIPEDIIENVKKEVSGNILIIRSQFASNELRNIIKDSSVDTEMIDCATWFSLNKEYAEDNDTALLGEDDLTDLLKEKEYDTIIADSDCLNLLKSVGFTGRFIDYPEFAVSGRGFDFTGII